MISDSRPIAAMRRWKFRFYNERWRFRLRANVLEDMSLSQNVLLGFRSVLRPQRRLLTYPGIPDEGYLFGKLCALVGYPCTNDPKSEFDFAWHFHDITVAPGTLPSRVDPSRTINARCLDISKRHVTKVFEEVFETSLAVDPTKYRGAAVRKNDRNALHDGQTIQCPIAPSEVREGFVYQRLVDNEAGDGLIMELRVVVMRHRIPIVYKKYRPLAARYSIPNTRVELCSPEEVFSEDERKNISRFAERIGMDFGELDVLRDRNTRNIYVIDANNTPMGPPRAFNKEETSRTFAILLPAFLELLGAEQ